MDQRTELAPNIADISAHLYALFPPGFVQPYPDAWVEVAFGHPDINDGAIHEAQNYSPFELAKIAKFAAAKNRAGFNMYVGPALRHGNEPGDGRANDSSVLTTALAWAEYDGAGDNERVEAILKAKQLAPAMVVTTGLVPNPRRHLYFRVGDTPTPDKLRAVNASLMKLLGSDAVHNASRLMRLAGTINYPSPKKAERGYVAELVTLQIASNPQSYRTDELIGLTGEAESNPFTDYARTCGSSSGGRTDEELLQLLKASCIKNWHNNMRDAIATMIGRGWSDSAIRFACAPYCDGGANDPDLDPLIDGGREKFDKPDPDQPQSQPDSDDDKEGDERAANQAPIASTLPVIQIHPRISVLTTETQDLLIGARVPFYQRSGELVRPIIRTVQAAHGHLTRTAQLKTISATHLRDNMCRHAHWQRFDERKAKWVKTMAPINVADTLLERDGVWGFPEIVGVIATPTLRPDGTLLIKQGYDPKTRLLLIEPPPMPPITDNPTRDDALKALTLLEELVCESPFVDEASKSVALSGMITPVVRGAFPVAPMHASSAPVAGSGKSHLCDMNAAISSGQQRMPVIAAGNEEETEKRLAGVMLTGQPLISIDNVNGELKGDFLCQAIEQHFLDIRPLGRSDIIRVETGAVTFYATGNNITICGDLCRRVITSRLDAKLENPQLRQFRNNPIEKILCDRGIYIAACLTICRAYIVAGRPGLLPRLASFGGWSDTVRSALVWLGKADAIDSMEDTRAEDPQRAVLSDLLHAWSQDHGTGSGSDVSLAVIIDKSVMLEKMGGMETGNFKFPELNAAVRAATTQIDGPPLGSKSDPARFGQYCKQKKGRIVDGLRLANKPSSRGGAATWWVETTGADDGGDGG
jgi:putative DNA primase/helicase